MPKAFIILFAALLFIGLPRFAIAAGENVAKGMVIYRSVGIDSPKDYMGALFLTPNPAGGWIEYEIGQTRPLRLERGNIVREIDLQPVFFADFVREEHLMQHTQLLETLQSTASQSPKTATLIKAVTNIIEENIRRFRSGEVRSRRVWISSQNYAKEKERDQEDEQKIIERRQNLKAAYVPAVAKPLLADYEIFTFRAGAMGNLKVSDDKTNVSSALSSFSTQLGKLEAGLKARSKFLPGSYSLNIVTGIYPSESEDGPAVLWAAKGDDLIALDVGVCLKFSQTSQELVNTQEIEQAKFFLSKFDETLFETVVDAIATSKIKAILSPVTLNDDFAALQKKFYGTPAGGVKNESVIMIGRLNTKKGEFTILQKTTARYKAIILVGKPATLADGTVRQFVIAQLR